jgi:hypothetical protein
MTQDLYAGLGAEEAGRLHRERLSAARARRGVTDEPQLVDWGACPECGAPWVRVLGLLGTHTTSVFDRCRCGGEGRAP